MQNKDKDEWLKVSPLDMLLVILLGRAFIESWVIKLSSLSLPCYALIDLPTIQGEIIELEKCIS